MSRELDGSGTDDLVACGHANLPAWAHGDAARFWAAADTLERRNGTVARLVEVALPRELSPQGRTVLAADIREVLMGTQFAHSWAIHEPPAQDGSGIMPHMHLMFSPRRQEDDQERTRETWFKQVNHGGVAPDPSWQTKGRLYDVRAAVALLSNAALAREGLTLAVDHRSLEARGFSRDPARYEAGNRADEERTQRYRRQLSEAGVTAYEQLATYAGWRDQAVHLLSLDREYVKDLCRDHVWRFDRSPTRQMEREQSMLRTLDRAMEDRPPTRTPTRAHTLGLERTPTRQVVQPRQPMRALATALERGEDRAPGGAEWRPRDHDRAHEYEVDRGF
jgi:MobA/MobL family